MIIMIIILNGLSRRGGRLLGPRAHQAPGGEPHKSLYALSFSPIISFYLSFCFSPISHSLSFSVSNFKPHESLYLFSFSPISHSVPDKSLYVHRPPSPKTGSEKGDPKKQLLLIDYKLDIDF